MDVNVSHQQGEQQDVELPEPDQNMSLQPFSFGAQGYNDMDGNFHEYPGDFEEFTSDNEDYYDFLDSRLYQLAIITFHRVAIVPMEFFSLELPLPNQGGMIPAGVLLDSMENSYGSKYFGAAPAAKEAIEALKVTKYKAVSEKGVKDSSNDVCVVCLEKLTEGDEVACMPCLHDQFHASCLFEWLDRSRYCPLCKSELPPADGWSSDMKL